jgi:hypothetical protein
MSADASSSSAPAAEESHPYTLETLKAHGTREDLWMLLHGKVYNVTKFLDEVSRRFAQTKSSSLGRARRVDTGWSWWQRQLSDRRDVRTDLGVAMTLADDRPFERSDDLNGGFKAALLSGHRQWTRTLTVA